MHSNSSIFSFLACLLVSHPSFVVSGLTLTSWILFQLVFVGDVDKIPTSFSCMWIFSFPSTTYWKYRKYFPHWMFLALLPEIIWPCMWGFISGLSTLLRWFICLSSYQYHLFWLLELFSKVWNQEVWALDLWRHFSRLFWLPRFLEISYKLWDGFFYFWRKRHWDFDGNCTGCIDHFE